MVLVKFHLQLNIIKNWKRSIFDGTCLRRQTIKRSTSLMNENKKNTRTNIKYFHVFHTYRYNNITTTLYLQVDSIYFKDSSKCIIKRKNTIKRSFYLYIVWNNIFIKAKALWSSKEAALTAKGQSEAHTKRLLAQIKQHNRSHTF